MDVLSFASADGIRWVVSWALPGDWSSAWSHGRCVPPRVPESEAWTWKKCERMWLRGGIPTLAVLGMILDVFWCAVLRIDENIIFRPLNLADLREIAKLQLKRVEKRLADRRGGPFALKSQEKRVGLSSTAFACRNITIDVTEPVPCLHFGAPIFHVPMVFPNSLMGLMLSVLGINIEVVEALDLIAQRGYDPTFGARQLAAFHVVSMSRLTAATHPSCGQGPSSVQLWPMWRLPWLRKVCPVNLTMVTLFLDWNFRLEIYVCQPCSVNRMTINEYKWLQSVCMH